ncbi:MAG: penicillin-binding protein 1A [Gammaproteobacteria bacterium]|nr:penicillin-binding protein 1A [Gammaproteobacteria bacterium]
MTLPRKLLLAGLLGLGGTALLGVIGLAASYLYIAPDLPPIDALRDIRLQVPMRIYTRDGKLIAEFGEQKRTPIRFEETPDLMVKAILAAEDDRFFEHPGVDYQGILRAALNLARTGEKSQGGSTITMQVARNFFLTSEKTYLRKLSEIFLALKIDKELSKEEILELYLNKIYLGNRAYGVGAAAYTYYGVGVADLSLAQIAMIAGLPKAPSRYNPLADPGHAGARRNYVLRRMRELGYIDKESARQATQSADDAKLHSASMEVEANYLAEMVRAAMIERYGEQAAYTAGLKIYTTLDSRLQQASTGALRSALYAYDRRHGFRGVEGRIAADRRAEGGDWADELRRHNEAGGLKAALVSRVQDQAITVKLADGSSVDIAWDGLSWAQPYLSENRRGAAPKSAADIVRAGDIVRIAAAPDGWQLAQLPSVQGALIALDPPDGAITALVGGFDFQRSKFNRVTQALRQPGSSFKPFLYSAALEKGFTPATLINDAPVVFDDAGLESAWRPENYTGEFFGPTRLRVALVNSRNLVSIRLLRSIGIDYCIDYLTRFGFRAGDMPRNLSLALGSASVTPLQLAAGYAVFANGGYRVAPYFIDHIVGANEEVLFRAVPDRACPECEEAFPAEQTADGPEAAALAPDAPGVQPAFNPARRTVSAQNAYLMTSMMRDVIQSGTGVRAKQLGRGDIAGKTGTTNDQRDAWFAGFTSETVAISWVGFDKPQALGNGETGSRAALPMWIAFMREALRGAPEHPLDRPPGLVTVRIDPDTGLLAKSAQSNGIFETFFADNAPRQYAGAGAPSTIGEETGAGRPLVPEQLF